MYEILQRHISINGASPPDVSYLINFTAPPDFRSCHLTLSLIPILYLYYIKYIIMETFTVTLYVFK